MIAAPEPPVGFDQAAEVLRAQPFSTLVGARLTRFETGVAVLEIPLRADLEQQHGFVHGGVLAYAADNALTFAGGTVLGPNIVTQDLAMSYLRPAHGVLLRAEAQVVTHRARHALCRCDLWAVGEDGENVLCAAAQGRISQRGREPDAG